MGFINQKCLGLDPKDSMEPPETISGPGDRFCIHAENLAVKYSVDDTLTIQYWKVGASADGAVRGAWWGPSPERQEWGWS